MKHSTLWASLWSVSIIVAGCSKNTCEADGHSSSSETMEFVCSTESGETKSQIYQNGNTLYWSPGDEIMILKGTEAYGKFISNNSEPSPKAKFSGTLTLTAENFGDALYYGIYPYEENCSCLDDAISIAVPHEQTATDGSFSPGSYPSVAKSQNMNMTFLNLCGGVRFKVVDSGVKTVTFFGNKSEIIAGTVQVKIDNDAAPYVYKVVDGKTQISLTSSDGLTPGQWYYISMLPVNLSEGFTITLSNGVESVSYVSKTSSSVKRSTIGQLTKPDGGLSIKSNWPKNDFVHNSLLLSIPNCVFSGAAISTPEAQINAAITQSRGHFEVAQMFANGSSLTDGIDKLINQFNISTVPFFLTDYRESMNLKTGTPSPYSTYSQTPSLYNTVSGISIKSEYVGNELNIEASLYFKEIDGYKVVVLVTEEGSAYPFSRNSGQYTGTIKADYLTRYVVSDILGEDVSVTSAPVIKYKSWKVCVSDEHKAGRLRVLIYLLRPYGSRTKVTNGSFGDYYVDNAFSARAGTEASLPAVITIDSEINSFQDGGTIDL